MLDLLIKNGTVITKDQTKNYDIGVRDGKIVELGDKITLEAKKEIDAAGKLIIPGVIDPHVHIHHPFRDSFSADDFYTASKTAALGGTTTFSGFAIQWDKDISLSETLQKRAADSAENSVIDFAFHVCPTKSEPETVAELKEIIEAGAPSFKMYMTYSKQGRMSDDGIFRGNGRK